MPPQKLRVVVVGAEQAPAMTKNLPQQRLASRAQVNQIDRATGRNGKLADEFRLQGCPQTASCQYRNIDITLTSQNALGGRTKENREPNVRMSRQHGRHSGTAL